MLEQLWSITINMDVIFTVMNSFNRSRYLSNFFRVLSFAYCLMVVEMVRTSIFEAKYFLSHSISEYQRELNLADRIYFDLNFLILGV